MSKPKKPSKAAKTIKAPKGEPSQSIATMGKKEATWLPLKSIVMPPKKLIRRDVMGDMEELISNIKKHGQLQSGLVRPSKKAGTFELLAGHRRYQALKSAGESHMLVQIRTDLDNDTEALAVVISENAPEGRFNLTPTEQARAFRDLYKDLGEDVGAVKKIAARCATSVENVNKTMKLLDAPKAIVERLESGDITKDAVIAFQQISDEGIQKKVSKAISEGRISTRPEIKQAAIEFEKTVEEEGGEVAAPKDKRKTASAARLWRGAREMTEKLEDLLYAYGVASGKWEDADYKDIYNDEDTAAALELQIAVFFWCQSLGGIKDIETESKAFKSAIKSEVQRVYEYHKSNLEVTDEAEEEKKPAKKSKKGDKQPAKKSKKEDAAEEKLDADIDESFGADEEPEGSADEVELESVDG